MLQRADAIAKVALLLGPVEQSTLANETHNMLLLPDLIGQVDVTGVLHAVSHHFLLCLSL